jgi:hypothetical protein
MPLSGFGINGKINRLRKNSTVKKTNENGCRCFYVTKHGVPVLIRLISYCMKKRQQTFAIMHGWFFIQ